MIFFLTISPFLAMSLSFALQSLILSFQVKVNVQRKEIDQVQSCFLCKKLNFNLKQIMSNRKKNTSDDKLTILSAEISGLFFQKTNLLLRET
jgi:hypothetical protein